MDHRLIDKWGRYELANNCVVLNVLFVSMATASLVLSPDCQIESLSLTTLENFERI